MCVLQRLEQKKGPPLLTFPQIGNVSWSALVTVIAWEQSVVWLDLYSAPTIYRNCGINIVHVGLFCDQMDERHSDSSLGRLLKDGNSIFVTFNESFIWSMTWHKRTSEHKIYAEAIRLRVRAIKEGQEVSIDTSDVEALQLTKQLKDIYCIYCSSRDAISSECVLTWMDHAWNVGIFYN